MQSLEINTGEVVIPIIRDGKPVGEVKFNPSDLTLANKFYKALGEMEKTATGYQRKIEALEADKTEGPDGLPLNMGARLELLGETCDAIKRMIDDVFGEGTSITAFGNAVNLGMFSQFFDGISPLFKTARSAKVNQYLPQDTVKRGKPRRRK